MKQLSNSIIANFSLLCYPGTSADAQVQVRTTLASLAGEISSLHSLNVTLFSFGYAEWHSNEGWNIIWKAVSEDKKMVKSLKGSFADWPSFDGITIAVAASQWRSGTKTAKRYFCSHGCERSKGWKQGTPTENADLVLLCLYSPALLMMN